MPIGQVYDLAGWHKAVSMRVQIIVAPAPPPNSELTALASPHSASAQVLLSVPTAAPRGSFVAEPLPAVHYDITLPYDRLVLATGEVSNPRDTPLELRVELSAPRIAQLGTRRAESHAQLGGGSGTVGLFLHNQTAASPDVASTGSCCCDRSALVLAQRNLPLDGGVTPAGVLNAVLTNHAPRDVVVTRLWVTPADGRAGVTVASGRQRSGAPPTRAQLQEDPPAPHSTRARCHGC